VTVQLMVALMVALMVVALSHVKTVKMTLLTLDLSAAIQHGMILVLTVLH